MAFVRCADDLREAISVSRRAVAGGRQGPLALNLARAGEWKRGVYSAPNRARPRPEMGLDRALDDRSAESVRYAACGSAEGAT